MRSNKHFLSIGLSIFLCSLLVVTSSAGQAQDSGAALQRGYRTGYSDGYMAGYRDTIDTVARNYTRHEEYSQADRAYSRDYGSLDDYRDGYKQGFEAGYDTGYDRRSFETTLPTDLQRRAGAMNDVQTASVETKTETAAETGTGTAAQVTQPIEQQQQQQQQQQDARSVIGTTESAYQTSQTATIVIPRDTELIIELQQDINTEQNREGDKFTARVAAPSEIDGATIEGRVSKIVKPGRINRRSELLLTFDRIIVSETRWSNMSAALVEVMPVKGDNVSKVDNEGTAIGQSTRKSDAIKVGGSTGVGAITGAVFGGPVGAAVGAGVGAAFGVGAVVIERGKHVRLNRNQQIRIKTAYETQIR